MALDTGTSHQVDPTHLVAITILSYGTIGVQDKPLPITTGGIEIISSHE
jgi:hypothetical protein